VTLGLIINSFTQEWKVFVKRFALTLGIKTICPDCCSTESFLLDLTPNSVTPSPYPRTCQGLKSDPRSKISYWMGSGEGCGRIEGLGQRDSEILKSQSKVVLPVCFEKVILQENHGEEYLYLFTLGLRKGRK